MSSLTSPMTCFPLPLAWSSLPPISVERSPPSLPASSLTLPLVSSHLPSVLSFMKSFPPISGRLGPQRGRQERCQPRGGIDFVNLSTMAVADVLGLGARLPAGNRGRDFADGDRDQFVLERNREQHWMEQGSAEEWRYWENLMKDPTLLRVSVEAPDGGIAAIGDIGSGFQARPDPSQSLTMTVLAPHRRKGIGSALLVALEEEARRRDVPKLLGGANEREKFALDWALSHGYREIGRRIASYVELAKFDPSQFSDALDRART